MLYINNITNDASQIMTLTGIPGVQITMTLKYLPRVQQWIMGVDDGNISIQGMAVVCGLNLLRQFRNNIPYGICCIRADGLDPYQLNDFADKAANLYLLNAADVLAVEKEFFV